MKRKGSPPEEAAPQKKHRPEPGLVIGPCLAPSSSCNSNNHNTENNGANLHANDPFTLLLLSRNNGADLHANDPVTSPVLAPYCNNNNENTENNGADLHANVPLTNLLLPTSPVLVPYTPACSSNGSNNNNSDNYGGGRVHENAPASASASSSPRRAPEVQETIVPPFPWAMNERARIRSFKYLRQNRITKISGRVQCKRCSKEFEMELDVDQKWNMLRRFMRQHGKSMNDRAPREWMEPVFPKCELCKRENSVAPVLAGVRDKAINWLFLFLNQMLGCCTIKQLKYFCKHTKSHRTASKDHLVYTTFVGLLAQFLSD